VSQALVETGREQTQISSYLSILPNQLFEVPMMVLIE
jgi:hypothetical protein